MELFAGPWSSDLYTPCSESLPWELGDPGQASHSLSSLSPGGVFSLNSELGKEFRHFSCFPCCIAHCQKYLRQSCRSVPCPARPWPGPWRMWLLASKAVVCGPCMLLLACSGPSPASLPSHQEIDTYIPGALFGPLSWATGIQTLEVSPSNLSACRALAHLLQSVTLSFQGSAQAQNSSWVFGFPIWGPGLAHLCIPGPKACVGSDERFGNKRGVSET